MSVDYEWRPQSKLSTLERTPDRALISAYASWDVARGLAQRTSKTGRPATRHARSLVIEAINLTSWLHTQELTLEDLHQDLLDEWVAAGTSRRRRVRLFVIWLKRNGACGELHVQRPQTASPTIPLADLERIETLHTLLANTALDPRDRLAGSLLLLYAQPITRIARFATSDVHTEQGAVAIRLGKGVLELPEPLAELALEVHRRAGTSRWLFPGRHPGRHLSPDYLRSRLKPTASPAAVPAKAHCSRSLHAYQLQSSPSASASTKPEPPDGHAPPALNTPTTSHYARQHGASVTAARVRTLARHGDAERIASSARRDQQEECECTLCSQA